MGSLLLRKRQLAPSMPRLISLGHTRASSHRPELRARTTTTAAEILTSCESMTACSRMTILRRLRRATFPPKFRLFPLAVHPARGPRRRKASGGIDTDGIVLKTFLLLCRQPKQLCARLRFTMHTTSSAGGGKAPTASLRQHGRVCSTAPLLLEDGTTFSCRIGTVTPSPEGQSPSICRTSRGITLRFAAARGVSSTF